MVVAGHGESTFIGSRCAGSGSSPLTLYAGLMRTAHVRATHYWTRLIPWSSAVSLMATAALPTSDVDHTYTTTGLDEPEDRDLGLYRLRVHAVRLADLDLPDLQGAERPRPVSARRRGPTPRPATVSSPVLDIPVTSQLDVRPADVVAGDGARAGRRREPRTSRSRGERILGNSKLWLVMTAALGATFLGFQAFEFTSFVHEGLTIHTQPVRVVVLHADGLPRRARHGRRALAADACWGSTSSAAWDPKDALNVDMMALYWHFVDVVWIAIFTLVYLIQ